MHAILGAAHNAFGNEDAAAEHVAPHLELVTTALAPTPPLSVGDKLDVCVVPGRVLEIPVPAVAGDIAITTSSKDYWNTIAVLVAPDGTPVVGSDDENAYFAAFDHVAAETYRLQVAFFEAVNTGQLVVART